MSASRKRGDVKLPWPRPGEHRSGVEDGKQPQSRPRLASGRTTAPTARRRTAQRRSRALNEYRHRLPGVEAQPQEPGAPSRRQTSALVLTLILLANVCPPLFNGMPAVSRTLAERARLAFRHRSRRRPPPDTLVNGNRKLHTSGNQNLHTRAGAVAAGAPPASSIRAAPHAASGPQHGQPPSVAFIPTSSLHAATAPSFSSSCGFGPTKGPPRTAAGDRGVTEATPGLPPFVRQPPSPIVARPVAPFGRGRSRQS